jgi:hypothetical protein
MFYLICYCFVFNRKELLQLESYVDRILYGSQRDPRTSPATENAFDQTYLGQLPLAMAYVPFQRWETLYDPNLALQRGTVFSSLDLPFCGRELV